MEIGFGSGAVRYPHSHLIQRDDLMAVSVKRARRRYEYLVVKTNRMSADR